MRRGGRKRKKTGGYTGRLGGGVVLAGDFVRFSNWTI